MKRVGVVFLAFLAAGIASALQVRADDVFSWRQASGKTLRVMLSRHPYSEGIKRRLAEFEQLTGIRVAFVMHPESEYFSELDAAFTGTEHGVPDVYMTGVYQVWTYADKGRMASLDSFLSNPSLTRQSYDLDDFYPGILGAFRWNGRAGESLGTGPLWALPIGFESTALIYNREVLARNRLTVPGSMEELISAGKALRRFEGSGTYGVAVRGQGEWNSIHSGYITAFANYGAKDMELENGRLVSRVNSPEAVAVTDLWVRMLNGCASEDWEDYNWVRCRDDIGDRKAAMSFDCDILGFYANFPGASPQSGKLGLAPPPMPPGSDPASVKTNLWIWGLAMNPATRNRDAAWLFIQYFTAAEFQAWSVLEWKSVNPPRRSVYEDPRFQLAISGMHGYSETFSRTIANAAVHFTPTPLFFDISKRWAEVIRDIANGLYGSTQEGMDTLKVWMDNKLSTLPTG